MPALPSVPGVLRCTLVQTLGEDIDCINRFFMAYTGGPPDTTGLTDMAAFMATSWGTRLAPDATPDLALTGINIEDLTSSTGASVETAHSSVGTNVGGRTPAGSCFVISFLTNRRYRGGHPRTYLGGKPASALFDETTWASGSVTSWVTDWTNFITDQFSTYTHAGHPTFTVTNHVNVSYYEGFTNVLYPSGRYRIVPTRRAVPIVDVITGYRGNHKIGSQRRRNLQSR